MLSLAPRLSTWRYPQPQLGRLQMPIDSRYAAPAAVNRYLLPAATLSSKPAVRRCCCRSTGQTERQTDGRIPDRCRDPAPHPMRAASWRPRNSTELYASIFVVIALLHYQWMGVRNVPRQQYFHCVAMISQFAHCHYYISCCKVALSFVLHFPLCALRSFKFRSCIFSRPAAR